MRFIGLRVGTQGSNDDVPCVFEGGVAVQDLLNVVSVALGVVSSVEVGHLDKIM